MSCENLAINGKTASIEKNIQNVKALHILHQIVKMNINKVMMVFGIKVQKILQEFGPGRKPQIMHHMYHHLYH